MSGAIDRVKMEPGALDGFVSGVRSKLASLRPSIQTALANIGNLLDDQNETTSDKLYISSNVV